MTLFTTTLGLCGGVLCSGELQGFIIHETMPSIVVFANSPGCTTVVDCRQVAVGLGLWFVLASWFLRDRPHGPRKTEDGSAAEWLACGLWPVTATATASCSATCNSLWPVIYIICWC
jgi:hypothetical protein